MLDGKVVCGCMSEWILWQPAPIAAHVRATQMKNADVEPFDAANLAFDIGGGGQLVPSLFQLTLSRKQRAQSTGFSRVFVDRERTQLKLVF